LPEVNKQLHKETTLEEKNISEFLEEMSTRCFFSQYSPHLLIISNSLLQLLGYDMEVFAVESIKYKTILNEFFSAEHYSQIIHKHL